MPFSSSPPKKYQKYLKIAGLWCALMDHVLTRLYLYIFVDQISLLFIWGKKKKEFLHSLKNLPKIYCNVM
jgi:hypothetical protein